MDIEGPGINISFNAKYIIDVLKAIDAENFIFSFNSTINKQLLLRKEIIKNFVLCCYSCTHKDYVIIMKIDLLTLYNYRNYNNLNLKLSSNINIFTGFNAQGKTNIIEAIYFFFFRYISSDSH